MSASLPEELLDQELFEDWDIPCEIPSINAVGMPNCGPAPAEWIAYRQKPCPCGIIVRLVCTPCKERYIRYRVQWAKLTCAGCGADTDGFNRFERLVKA